MNRLLLWCLALALPAVAFGANPANPILFVTQVPMPEEVDTRTVALCDASCVSPFSNHLPDAAHAGRGGSLFIRFSNAQVLDLLSLADWSAVSGGKPAANAVAVRNPNVNWTADKAIFSMITSAPSAPAQFLWQLYEITLPTQAQLNASVKPVVTLVANQPAYNNVFPAYALGGKIVFSSDRPYNGQPQLTQREEYLGLPTVSGIWSLDPASAASIKLLHHSMSGAFSPNVDSFGRLISTNWDHLDRDPQAVTDSRAPVTAPPYNETFVQTFNGSGNFSDESAGASFTQVTAMAGNTWDIFPEPRSFDRKTLIDVYGSKINGNAFNLFMPWMINLDGTAGEILNHVGRHEVAGAFTKSFVLDTNLVDLNPAVAPGYGGLGVRNLCNNLIGFREDPLNPGSYYGVDAPNVGTHTAGQIVRLNNAGAGQNPDGITITYITGGANGKAKPAFIPTVKPSINLPVTVQTVLSAGNAESLYRTPVALADGSLVASHAAAVTQTDYNSGTVMQPATYFSFRLKSLKLSGTTYVPDVTLTAGLTINTSYYVGATPVSYNGPAWELDPAEVAPRTPPAAATASIDPIEAGVFTANGVDLPTFQNYLVAHHAALSVSRDITKRDGHDRQQPFNLNVVWSNHQTVAPGTTGLYNVAWEQFLQADLLRGYLLGGGTPAAGRRVVATPLHDTASENPPVAGAPGGAVRIGDDGSVAAILPAGKALTWHLLDNDAANTSQVKERFWITFQPGEIRTCANCHGINTADQAGASKPTNPPQALATLLQFWKANHPPGAMQHAAASAAVLKSAGSVTLNVTRTGGSTGPVSVHFATANATALAGQDYAAASGALTWADGDTAPKPVTVSLLGNPAIAASKTFTVQLSSPLNGSLGATVAATVSVNEPPFGAWAFAKFGAAANNLALNGPAADPDGDGLANLLEYAYNADPLSPAASAAPAPFTEIDPTDHHPYLTLIYHRRKTPRDITYHVETSTSFGTWNEGPGYVSELSATDDGNGLTESVKARAVTPIDQAPLLFLRIRITNP